MPHNSQLHKNPCAIYAHMIITCISHCRAAMLSGSHHWLQDSLANGHPLPAAPHLPSATSQVLLSSVAGKLKSEISRCTAGEVSTFAGQCESPGEHDGDSSEAQFSTAIQGVACLSNCSVLVADPSSRCVRIIDVGGHCPRSAAHPQTHPGEQEAGRDVI